MDDVGIVAIGRNEGERLSRCLESVRGAVPCVVYVDSGSTDGSVSVARELGAEVVELDLSTPFTAARARNEGLSRLLDIAPKTRFVQFVDGDCELAPDWIERSRAELEARPRAAVVFGRRRERHPEDSVYNRFADIEWDVPIGEVKGCGGDAMMRTEAVLAVGGYNPAVIAGEDSELSVRLRREGWTLHRIDAEMTLHDMGMTRFGQWWRRMARAGHAFAEGSAMHGLSRDRFFVREAGRAVAWGVIAPVGALALAWPTWGLSLAALAAAHAASVAKTYRGHRGQGRPVGDSAASALFTVPSRYAEAQGVLRYWMGRLSGRRSRIVEYRGPSVMGPGS